MVLRRFFVPAFPAAFIALLLALVLAACGQRDEAPTPEAEEAGLDTAALHGITAPDAIDTAATAAEPGEEGVYAPDFEGMTQLEAGIEAIFALLTADLDTIRPHFEEEIRPNLSEEHAKILVGQIGWLYGLIGGDFEQFMSGWSMFEDSTPAFFREYRMVNETNKRAPLLLVHMVFADSVTPYVAGLHVKNFLGPGQETRLSGEQTWRVDGKDVDIHEVKVVDAEGEGMLAVMFFDTDTTALDTQDEIFRRGVPVVRAALEAMAYSSAELLSTMAAAGQLRVPAEVGCQVSQLSQFGGP
jgi:hypothetical protein